MMADDADPHVRQGAGQTSHEQPLLLREHVRRAVKDYLDRLNGDEVSNLYSMVLHEIERPLIQAVMEKCGHNQSKAAQMLGLSRSTLRKKMAAPGLSNRESLLP